MRYYDVYFLDIQEGERVACERYFAGRFAACRQADFEERLRRCLRRDHFGLCWYELVPRSEERFNPPPVDWQCHWMWSSDMPEHEEDFRRAFAQARAAWAAIGTENLTHGRS